MRRQLLASLIAGSGVAFVASTLAPTFAQEDKNRARPDTQTSRDSSSDETAQRVDKAIQAYQNRTNQELEDTRKGIDRMRKELSEATDSRIDMAIALAELRADSGVRSNGPGVPGSPRALGSYPSPGGGPGPNPGANDSGSDTERQQRRASVLNQELRQVAELLHNELQQERSQTDQLVSQLRALRAQNRQQQEQLKAAEERSRRAENKDQKNAGPQNAAPKSTPAPKSNDD